MIQLSYQPALDPFHSVFRLIRLLPYIASCNSLPRDHVRILDYYLLYPFRISAARLSPQHSRFRKFDALFQDNKPYGEQPEDAVIFARMAPIQCTAMETLADKLIIDPTAWQHDVVRPTGANIPEPLAQRALNANANEPSLTDLIGVLTHEYPLTGRNGLKDRTGLLEHRYDAI
ncbi:ABC-three component system middle component 5 [Tardiphaga sp. 866_E4_N2_1]|uniref:ABC-three component system middle component 5 n=1 Tax=unclassified Tardiphaga TaxID=2631404 RepID=UPI003F246F6C